MKEQVDYILPGSIRDAIIQYLRKRPYEEVEIGIHALRSLKPLVDEEEKDESISLPAAIAEKIR